MRLPNWLKTRTQTATEKTIDELAMVRARLSESIKELENAVSEVAIRGERQDAD